MEQKEFFNQLQQFVESITDNDRKALEYYRKNIKEDKTTILKLLVVAPNREKAIKALEKLIKAYYYEGLHNDNGIEINGVEMASLLVIRDTIMQFSDSKFLKIAVNMLIDGFQDVTEA